MTFQPFIPSGLHGVQVLILFLKWKNGKTSVIISVSAMRNEFKQIVHDTRWMKGKLNILRTDMP